MMGAEGLLKATQVAILSANYIAANWRLIFPCCTQDVGAWLPMSASSTCAR